MKTESIAYSVSGLKNMGTLVYDESAKTKHPLLLMAPNWLGITPVSTETARTLLADRYVVFMAECTAKDTSRPARKIRWNSWRRS
jgi:hypothetical protein